MFLDQSVYHVSDCTQYRPFGLNTRQRLLVDRVKQEQVGGAVPLDVVPEGKARFGEVRGISFSSWLILRSS